MNGTPSHGSLYIGTAEKTHTEAGDECTKKGGHLFDPRSEEDLQNWKGIGLHWTGIKTVDSEVTWAYSDGSQLSEWALNNVRSAAYDYCKGKQTCCVWMFEGNSGFAWGTDSCNQEKKYACDLTKDEPEASLPEIGTRVENCEDGAIGNITDVLTDQQLLEVTFEDNTVKFANYTENKSNCPKLD